MDQRPTDIQDAALLDVLASDWDVHPVRLDHLPVGFGAHHWVAETSDRLRVFVTLDDLDDGAWRGRTRAVALDELCRALDTAVALRGAGLEFVVAALPSSAGATVRRVGARYAMSVFPYLDAASGDFGDRLTAGQRAGVVQMLARLHRCGPHTARVPARSPALPVASLSSALDGSGDQWSGGPFAEPARALVAGHAGELRRRLADLERLIAQVTAAGRTPVITHGEPHPGNLLRTADAQLLIDWDTVGLAAPERDLWMLATGPDAGAVLDQYAELTGYRPDPAAIELYRLRWDLEDLSIYLHDFRSAHVDDADTRLAWRSLDGILRQLTTT